MYLDGAYRLHRPEDVARFTDLAKGAFPNFASRIECFGVDWLGRQFATDRSRLLGGFPQVLMLEPGTGAVLEIPFDQTSFHEQELVEEPDAGVAYPFFLEWLKSGGKRPFYDQCVGYKRPLYLGGADDITNLEIADLDVYWTLAAQLLARVSGSPA
ncbi:MAG: hypothetical protein JWL96_598 [Sphingomonas bacterium]|uniref:T6SS immunity protein Tdi1 domain-containing protein n=1 Tax=Sphingomonas bacterium TaxID=1895847 RepID=UPI00260AF81F|nr:T6SS immunity protein Tdi1 domain-containing protein [Sphingomonas bacterium]MDB5708528.1 hypothetical protein [Sphingomonas bacterium]